MQGVNIVEEFVYSQETSILFAKILCVVLTVLIAIVIFAAWYLVAIVDAKIVGTLVAMFLTAILTVTMVFCWDGSLNLQNNPYTEYKVTIDDDVNFNEFMSHYEIISNDGNTYIVKEKPTE